MLNLFCVSACLGALACGCCASWTSPALPYLQHADRDNPVSVDQGTWIGSILAIGALVAAIPTGICAEKIGRKITLMALSAPFLISWGLIILSLNVYVLYLARFLAGISVGGICVVGVMYIGEIAEMEIRGTLGSFFQMFMCIGILLTFVLGAQLSYSHFSMALAIVPVIYLIAMKFMPESPIYLLQTGDRAAAIEAIRWLRGPDFYIQPVLAEMQSQIDASAAKKATVMDLFKSKGNIRALISSLGLMLFQQFSGINAVIFYTVNIFESAGSKIDSNLATILVGVVQVILAYVATLIMEKAGRKFFLILSASIMMVCLFGMGFYYQRKAAGHDVSSIGLLPLGSLMVFIIGFSLGFGPIPWNVMSELFAPDIKGVASGIAVMFNWALVFVVTKSFGAMVLNLGSALTFYTFMSFMILGIVFVIFLVPETKGKSLQEIQDELNGRSRKGLRV